MAGGGGVLGRHERGGVAEEVMLCRGRVAESASSFFDVAYDPQLSGMHCEAILELYMYCRLDCSC